MPRVQAAKQTSGREGLAERAARVVTQLTGSTLAFNLALATVLLWALLGPIFHFSDTWQLVINTGTTIITFLMVFLIQRTQNKDSLAIELKLNEIVAALEGASNRLVNVEDLSEKELQNLHERFKVLAERAKREASLAASHSIDESQERSKDRRSRTGRTAG